MKKFMKTCGVLAVTMILTGIVMIAVAGAVKGPQAIAAIKEYVSTGLDKLDSGIRFDIESALDFNDDIPVITGEAQQIFAATEVRKLEVEVGASQLSLAQSPDADFHVNVEGAGSYQGYVNDETLIVKLNGPAGAGVGAIHLLIPADFCFESVTISLGAGEISADTMLRAEELEIELAAGEITIPDLEVGQLSTEVGAGSLSLGGNILEGADLQCGMGELELTLVEPQNHYNYKVEVAAGEVTVGNESFAGIAGERDIDNGADKDIEVECAMGSVKLTFEQ